jgi:phage gp36-like protein
MAYATVSDMVSRFGEAEMIRLTTPEGQDAIAIDTVAVTRALTEASMLVDSYARKRYLVPMTIVPPEIARATCMLARYDLSLGENREPSEQTRLARKEVLDWLRDVSTGAVLLDLAEVPAGDDSYAEMQDRSTLSGRLPPFGTSLC